VEVSAAEVLQLNLEGWADLCGASTLLADPSAAEAGGLGGAQGGVVSLSGLLWEVGSNPQGGLKHEVKVAQLVQDFGGVVWPGRGRCRSGGAAEHGPSGAELGYGMQRAAVHTLFVFEAACSS
jgi:hypothetical protein